MECAALIRIIELVTLIRIKILTIITVILKTVPTHQGVLRTYCFKY